MENDSPKKASKPAGVRINVLECEFEVDRSPNPGDRLEWSACLLVEISYSCDLIPDFILIPNHVTPNITINRTFREPSFEVGFVITNFFFLGIVRIS